MTITDTDIDRMRRLPKAEIHIHLEGCFEADELARLAAAVDEPLPRPVEQLFDFHGFDEFLEFLSWSCGLVRTPEAAAPDARQFVAREAAAGARYADVIINPTHWATWRSNIGGLIDALDQGFAEGEADGGPPVGLCISLLRQQSAAEAAELVDLLLELRHPRVVALSIDGNERMAGRVSSRFADAFQRAGAAGLKRTVHAGESSGPEGVRDAIDLLGADRIDHGVRAIEEPELVRELADRGIPLDICPRSNVTLGIVPSFEEHPIDALRTAGVPVSVNTDDPAFLGNSLHGDYAEVTAAFGWSDDVVRSVARTSIEASFADDDTKAAILEDLARW
ncbi:MAG: adenosine deaminase [Ilumatobacteraceae bacterium]|nr:adenosine deaminase [Ilumatobacteraceae bacterium]